MINQAGKKIDYKSERGITLITLTITIIILVILASITVGVAFGDNGLLKGSEKIEQVKRIEKYKTTIEGVAYEQYTDYIMEDKQGSLRDKTKNKIKTLDFVKEANNGAEDDEINVITNELYLIVVKLDNENADIIHEGENDNEPLPKIAREYVGKENGKYKIKASATVEKTEKTTSVTTLKLIEKNNIIENYEEGKEITFEVDKPGKYWIEATTNVGKSVKEPVVVEREKDDHKASFEATISEDNYIYDGNAKEPEVTVKDGTTILTKDLHYELVYSNNVNAGTGKVTIIGKGIYNNTVLEKTFIINKAIVTIPTQYEILTYNNVEQSPNWSNYNANLMTIGGTTKGINAGSYNATFTLKNILNYQWNDETTTTKTVEWKIDKANGYITLDENKNIAYGTESTTFEVRTNHGGTLSISNDNNIVTSTISGTTVTVANLSTINAGIAVNITVVSSATINYKEASATFTLTIEKTASTITVSNDSKIIQDGTSSTFTYTYNGDGAITVNSSDTSIATCSVNTSTKTVTVNALKTSTKEVIITINAGNGTNYNSASKQVKIGAIVVSGIPTNWTKNDVTITATTTLTGHTIKTMKDEGTWQTASSQTFTANGAFSVKAVNSSNESAGSRTVNITKIDKTAPEITKYDASVSGTTITASMTATDNCGLTPSYSYKIGTGNYQTSNKFTISKAGTYIIYFRAVDAAGNEKVVSKNVTVSSYTVTYNANGGSGAPASQTAISGVNLTLSSTVPTRTGYTFLGWSTSSTATTATYAKGATYTANKTATLYAVWKQESYSISIKTYDVNSGSEVSSQPYEVTITIDGTSETKKGVGNITFSANAGSNVKIVISGQTLATNTGPNGNGSVYVKIDRWRITGALTTNYQTKNNYEFTMPSGDIEVEAQCSRHTSWES